MIKFIGKYTIPGTEASTMKELTSYLDKAKIVYVDSEALRIGRSTIKMDIFDLDMTLFQIGDKYNQWIIDTRTESMKPLKKYLESTKIQKVGHNIKFDYELLYKCFKIRMENVFDTMIAEYVLRNNSLSKPRGYYSLEYTHQRYTGINPYGNQLSLFDPWIPKKIRDNIGADEHHGFPEVFYAATDLVTAARVHEHQLRLLDLLGMQDVMLLENEFVLVLGDMEYNGMPIDLDRWLELDQWAKEQYQKAEQKLRDQYPEIENWNSPKQVVKLFKSLGIKVTVRDKKKSRESGETILKDSVQEIVIKDQAKDFPIIADYLWYKGIGKVYSSYGIKFLSNVSPITKRIHSSFLQIKNTGRTGSANPNMQNIINAKEDFPEGVWWREAFTAPEGRTFIICDYTSQELHVLADQAEEDNMLEALRNKQDLHSLTASKMYKVEVSKKVNGHLRPLGKKLNFTIPYGGGADKIAHEFKLPAKEANKLLNNFYDGYPKLKPHFDAVYNKSLADGYITVDKYGRKFFLTELEEVRRLKELIRLRNYSSDKRKLKVILEQIRRNSQNYCIQGTSASISKLAGILLRKRLRGTSAKILLLIHDEWVVECDKTEALKVKAIVENCMTEAADALCHSITIPADAIVNHQWNKD